MFRVPEGFETFTVSSGRDCRWSGVMRSGDTGFGLTASGVISLCRKLQSGEADKLFKASAKISAGIVDGYFVKMYKLPGLSAQLRRRFRMGRAMHSLLAAEAVTEARVATPRIFAAVELKCKYHICDFLITGVLHETQLTCNFALPGMAEAEQIDFLLYGILPVIAALHRNGIAHGDLNLRNIYRTETSAGCLSDNFALASAGVIDLDGSSWHSSPLPIAVREQELARLISGFCKLCRTFSCADVIDAVLESYGKLCEVQCSRDNILRRAEYLLHRTR